MPVNRIEQSAAKTEEGAAAAPAAGAPAPASGGGIKSWLPLIITAVAMPLLAFGMTEFVLLPQLKKSLGVSATTSVKAKEAKPAPDAKRESVPMNKLLVNVSGTMGARYLLVSLTLSGAGAEFKERIMARDAQLRDFACGVLATKTIADLEKPGARNLIRSELLSGFNNILGSSDVQEIYLTEFAIQ